MRRTLSLILLCLLPLIWSTAAVAAYCQDEKAPVTQQHFGHHAMDKASGDGASPGDDGQSHAKCALCHFCCLKAIPVVQFVPQPVPVALPLVFERANIPDHVPGNPFRPPLTAGL